MYYLQSRPSQKHAKYDYHLLICRCVYASTLIHDKIYSITLLHQL